MAVAVLMLGAGVRLAVVPAFALLAAVAVVGSVRTVGQLLATVAAGLGALALWLVPLVLTQTGGMSTWLHAVHVQLSEAAHRSSVFVAPASDAITNIGTFGGWSVVSLGPVLVVGILAVITLAGARMVTGQPAGNVTLRIWGSSPGPTGRFERPWYQRTGFILGAAIVPPVALVILGRFAGGGDVLWYLAPVAILALLPVGRLLHHRAHGVRRTVAVLSTVLVMGIVAVDVQRFVAAPAILPASVVRHHPDWWFTQARFGAPYAETAATIGAG